jgi:hypothetical protein
VIYIAEHVQASHFDNGDADARESWYGGISGVPTVKIDGSYTSVGGGDGCTARFNEYRTDYNARMAETGGVSPVGITDGYLVLGGGTIASVQATFTLLDPTSLGSVQATFFLYEDNITWCCGYGGASHWDEIERAIKNEPVTTLINVGDTVTISKSVTLDSSWSTANLHAVAIIQQTTGSKPIIQAARLNVVTDFALNLPRKVGSVPAGNGVITFAAGLKNTGSTVEQLDLSSTAIGGWTGDFQLQGDPTWYTSTSISVPPGGTKPLTLRVQTDGIKQIGTASLTIHSYSSGRTQVTPVRIFNGSYAVLLVDDDNGTSYGGVPFETPFLNGLNALGDLYDDWDIAVGHAGISPAASDMLGFDVVLWETAYISVNPITPDDIAALQTYLSLGGKLFLSSMGFLSSQSGPTTFITDYLGVASWVNDTKAHTVTGVTGDPITDGMVLPLTFPNESYNKVDTVNPTATSSAIFYSETNNPAAVRHQLASGGGQTVFSSILQSAFSETDDPPNNSQTVIRKVLDWLLPPDPASVSEPMPASTALLWANPNPFAALTRLSFNVSPHSATGPVHLTLVDASGRVVRDLIHRSLTPGLQQASWDGRDDNGRPVPAGMYFVRLQSLDGTNGGKLVLLR